MVVTKIEATEKVKPRVCAYVRVSTDKIDQENSFVAQSELEQKVFRFGIRL